MPKNEVVAMGSHTRVGPVLSPVDYDAWQRGYMPPSEHHLIDQLAHRGAKVVMSSDWGDTAWWLVIRGQRITGKRALAIRQMIEDALEVMQDEGAHDWEAGQEVEAGRQALDGDNG